MSFSSNGIACFSSSKISVLNNETKVFHLAGALMEHFLEGIAPINLNEKSLLIGTAVVYDLNLSEFIFQ